MKKSGLPEPPGMLQDLEPHPYTGKEEPKEDGPYEKRIKDLLRKNPSGMETRELRKKSGMNPLVYWLVVESLLQNGWITRIQTASQTWYVLNNGRKH